MRHEPDTSARSWKHFIFSAAIVAAVLKMYCAATTYGSPDVTLFCRFGALVNQFGVSPVYRIDPYFNHTPFTGHFVGWILALGSYLTPAAPHIVPRSFPFLLRLPSIVADVIALLFLMKIRDATGRPPMWSLILFALSPVAFMVSGYHGNVDSVMVCLLVGAAYFSVSGRVATSALLLAAACAVKIIPLLVTPVFFFFWYARDPKKAFVFSAVFAAACLASWSEALIKAPTYFVANVLGYSSFPGGWGLTYLAAVVARRFGAQSDPIFLESLLTSVTVLKLVTVICVVALACLRRNSGERQFLDRVALSWVCFAILAPGFVPYYLVWLAPFVLLCSAPWYAVIAAASSVYLFAYYTIMNHGRVWNVSDPTVRPTWSVWGTLPWLVLVAFALVALFKLRNKRATYEATFPNGDPVLSGSPI